MKRTALILLLTLISRTAFATNWCQDANITACYTIEDGSGTTITDQSSNANNLTFKGAGEPAWDSTDTAEDDAAFLGTSSWSVDFDASDDYAQKLSASSMPTADFTIVFWAKSSDWGDTLRVPVDLYDADGSPEILTYFTSGDDFYWWTPSTNKANIENAVATYTTVNQWTHWACVGDENSYNDNEIYIDGVLRTTNQTDYAAQANIDTIRIGTREGGTWPWDDELDEVAIFTDVKDATDINDILQNGLVPSVAVSVPFLIKNIF